MRLRCSRLTVYRAISDGRLDAVRLGSDHGPLRVSTNALDCFLQPVTAPPRGRDVLVYLDHRAEAEALRVAPSVCIEPIVERAIARGRLSRQPRDGEPELAEGERLVRPFDDPGWVAVVRRHGGRVRQRSRSCWRIVRVVPVAPATSESA